VTTFPISPPAWQPTTVITRPARIGGEHTRVMIDP